MSTLALLGGGGHASDVLCVVEALGIGVGSSAPTTVLVADDAWGERGRFAGRPVTLVDSLDDAVDETLGAGDDAADATRAPDHGPDPDVSPGGGFARGFVAAVGYPGSRRAITERALARGGRPAAALVHPSTIVGSTTIVGRGVVIMGQTWISAGVVLDDHVHVAYGTTIGHDTRIGSYGAVMPSASISGDVTIGHGVVVGTNATILQGLTVGDGAVIGGGAVVTRDVAPGATVVGSPARRLETDRR